MHIKFLAHGTGDPLDAAVYLIDTHDHNGFERAEVRVLRGNPMLVAEVASSLKTVHRYTSGVISWHADDAPTDDEIDAVLDDFERVAFSGLEPDQYCWSAILHVDQDGTRHLHVFAARVELSSGRAFNMAPPGWEKAFNPLRDAWNLEKGWARPDDPARARLVQPGRMAPVSRSTASRNQCKVDRAQEIGMEASDIRDVLMVEPDQKMVIADWLMRRIRVGEIKYRQDILDALGELGEVNRVSKGYVSVRLAPGEKPIRLKGALFAETFESTSLLAAQAVPRHVFGGGRESPNPQAAAAARLDLQAAIERRGAYNRGRYPAPAPSTPASLVTALDVTEVLPVDQPDLIEVPYDRTRNSLVEAAERVFAAARTSVRRLIGACRAAVPSLAAAERASRAAERAGRAAERAGRAVMTGRADELERFKGEINLVEFAQSLGYEVIKKESSSACAVMKCGGDKVVVATDKADGHGIYFNVGDQADSGSVIDFAQRRLGGNLGVIRKELRGWCYTPKAPSPKRRPPEERPERPEPVGRDRAELLAKWARMTPYAGSYLTKQRGLDPKLIAAWRVRQDERGNALFAHYDAIAMSGWESKNNEWTGFAAGGQRGLGMAVLGDQTVASIVVTESSIDSISYCQLDHRPGTAYASLGGALSDKQRELLRDAMRRYPAAQVIAATDADEAGDAMAARIVQLAPDRVTRHRPPGLHKDWNDALLGRVGSDNDTCCQHPTPAPAPP